MGTYRTKTSTTKTEDLTAKQSTQSDLSQATKGISIMKTPTN